MGQLKPIDMGPLVVPSVAASRGTRAPSHRVGGLLAQPRSPGRFDVGVQTCSQNPHRNAIARSTWFTRVRKARPVPTRQEGQDGRSARGKSSSMAYCFLESLDDELLWRMPRRLGRQQSEADTSRYHAPPKTLSPNAPIDHARFHQAPRSAESRFCDQRGDPSPEMLLRHGANSLAW